MAFWFSLLFSFCLVAFGQPAWSSELGLLAAIGGYALFWKTMLYFSTRTARFLFAGVWFAAVHAIQLSWMTSTHYMGPLILIVYFLLLLGLGAQFGLLSCFVNLKVRHLYFQNAALAGGFVFLEWMRVYFLTGFTWNPAGLALAGNRYSLQLATLWGIYGMSFWVILTNLGALAFFLKPSWKKAMGWGCLALFPYGYGILHEAVIMRYFLPEKYYSVALVETGLSVEEKNKDKAHPLAFISPLVQWERIWQLFDPSAQVQMIVLPEAAFPFGFDRPFCPVDIFKAKWKQHFGGESSEVFPPLEPPYAFSYEKDGNKIWVATNAFFAQTLANHFEADLIVGLDCDDAERKTNAALIFHPDGSPFEKYDKQILVPVGEYIPMSNIPWIADFLARQFGIEEAFDVGTESKLFLSHVPTGVAICTEEIYSGHIRELRKRGAKLLVSLSNDVWFPSSKLARQHFEHGRIRAVENGVYLLRSCNMGMTGGIDCFGQPMDINSCKGVAEIVNLSIPCFSYSTFYTYWGNAGILVLSAICILSFFLVNIRANGKLIRPAKPSF